MGAPHGCGPLKKVRVVKACLRPCRSTDLKDPVYQVSQYMIKLGNLSLKCGNFSLKLADLSLKSSNLSFKMANLYLVSAD